MSDTTLRATSRSSLHPTQALRLAVIIGDELRTLPLPKEGTVVIGRAESADIRIASPRISREHLRLHIGEFLEVEDLGSANGTVVRNRRIPAFTRFVISPSEAIGLADNALCVVQPLPDGSSEPDPAAHPKTLPPPALSPENTPSSLDLPAHMLVVDEQMKRLVEMAARVAAGAINVLILGETGSGKELLAETIHRSSPRRDKPFLCLNCAAFTESLLESELFGHERGAFTGAHKTKTGLLESAPGGTVFLDELGEMAPATQVKLLRALESREVLRIGGVKPRPIDVRFVAATNRDLAEEVSFGRFRKDLYFRLNAITLLVPPLRERKAEIRALAERFLELGSRATPQAPRPMLSPEAIAQLEAHSWPGNVRELRNVIERALLLSAGTKLIGPQHLALETPRSMALRSGADAAAQLSGTVRVASSHPPASGDEAARPTTIKGEMAAMEKQRIIEALETFAGNQTRAAAHLGMSRRTFIKRLDAYELLRPRKPDRE